MPFTFVVPVTVTYYLTSIVSAGLWYNPTISSLSSVDHGATRIQRNLLGTTRIQSTRSLSTSSLQQRSRGPRLTGGVVLFTLCFWF